MVQESLSLSLRAHQSSFRAAAIRNPRGHTKQAKMWAWVRTKGKRQWSQTAKLLFVVQCICKGFEFLTHARVNQKGVSRPPKDEPQSLWKAVAPKKRPSMPCPKNKWFSPVQDATPCAREPAFLMFCSALEDTGGNFTLVSIVELQWTLCCCTPRECTASHGKPHCAVLPG